MKIKLVGKRFYFLIGFIQNTFLQTMIENHEEDIEEWYFDHKADDINKDESGSSSLEDFLCRQGRMLKTKSDQQCLDDAKIKKSKKSKKKLKGETENDKSKNTEL